MNIQGTTRNTISQKLRRISNDGIFPNIGFYIAMHVIYQNTFDEMLYGTSGKFEFSRKWYNPIRYLIGKNGVKRIDPRKKLGYMKKDWKYFTRVGAKVE